MHWHVIKQSWVKEFKDGAPIKVIEHPGDRVVLVPGHCKVHGHTHRDAPRGHTHYGDLGSVATQKIALERTRIYTDQVKTARLRYLTAREARHETVRR